MEISPFVICPGHLSTIWPEHLENTSKRKSLWEAIILGCKYHFLLQDSAAEGRSAVGEGVSRGRPLLPEQDQPAAVGEAEGGDQFELLLARRGGSLDQRHL